MKGLRVLVNVNSNILFTEDEYDNWSYDGTCLMIEKDGGLVALYTVNNIIGALKWDDDDTNNNNES